MNANQEAAANALLNAQRTGCQHAITNAEAYQRFQASQTASAAARAYEAARLENIGAAGRYDESQAGAHFYTH